ncbi:Ribbon-helix-helix domain-containing protein [Tangfeifania diversioriginum]|uniref:Ribbon-helix-helix domain-containing protein n=1 Tax=Tangfeifania diversioriginum TaxID=1168035 RepID=A0A1M6I0D4_9BACT|nr:ribbon-helix-helix domain-containing protein [Tangfeifania diversioriginum]SHJ27734.1 Ribbon-helix-helix domain-containing protein [Tangfeifania diversioriginum]
MKTFTSTLPDDLLISLKDTAEKLAIPKNKIIEKALRIYLDQLNRAEYVKSFKQAATDNDIIMMAEEGMEEYLKQVEKFEK